jgi:hypothetical protein
LHSSRILPEGEQIHPISKYKNRTASAHRPSFSCSKTLY